MLNTQNVKSKVVCDLSGFFVCPWIAYREFYYDYGNKNGIFNAASGKFEKYSWNEPPFYWIRMMKTLIFIRLLGLRVMALFRGF